MLRLFIAGLLAALPVSGSAATITYDWAAALPDTRYTATIEVAESPFLFNDVAGGDFAQWCLCDDWPDHWTVAPAETIRLASNMPAFDVLHFFLVLDEMRNPMDWFLMASAPDWFLRTSNDGAFLDRFAGGQSTGGASLIRRAISPIPIPPAFLLLLGGMGGLLLLRPSAAKTA
jgi:hypothetical protein